MKHNLSLLLTTSLFVISCASSGTKEIDNALLSELDPATMNTVVEARSERDQKEDSLAKAERDTKWAEEQVDLARSSLRVSRAKLDEAKLAMLVAEKSGTVSQLELAKKDYEYALAHAEEQRKLLALRKRERDVARLSQRLALEELRLAKARVDLQKAEAIQELDRVAAKQVPVKDYRKQFRFHETEVELARVRLKAAGNLADEARVEYEEAASKALSMRPATMS